MGFMQFIATVNTTARTLLGVAVAGMIGAGGWYGYTQYHKSDIELQKKDEELEARQKRIEALEKDLTQVRLQKEKLELAVRLLKVEHRLAWVDIVDSGTDDKGQAYNQVVFTEIDDENKPIAKPKEIRIKGNEVHVSGWVVKFNDSFVENGDPNRGTALFAFKSIYGNEQKPIDGQPLDTPNEPPSVYGSPRNPSDFEKQIWDDFWNLTHDPKRRHSLGVRSSHGATVFLQPNKGKRYKINLRASGDLHIDEEGKIPATSGNTL